MKINHEESWEYFQKETEYLRVSYGEMRKEIRSLEVYALMLVAGIWGWSVSNSASPAAFYLAWLAFIAIFLFGTRSLGIYFQMRLIRKYLLEIEANYNTENKIWWEQFQNTDPTRIVWSITSVLFWTILSIATSLFPFLIKVWQ
jgi:hypothetical protein